MNAQRNPDAPFVETPLRTRAAALRAATAKQAAPEPARNSARFYADQFDFSALSVMDIARLYEVVKQLDLYFGHLSNMPLCTEAGAHGYPSLSPVGRFIESEEERIAFLRDRCVAEIARRVPQTKHERDEILTVRIAHALDCESRLSDVTDPGLLIDALKAWG